MIIYSYSLVKTAFVSLLMISSVTIEATCSNSVSDLFNSIVGIPSANEGKHSAASNSNQRPLELKLADAQMLQQWIGQIARKIVVEDGIFAGIYSCGPKSNIDAEIQNSEEKSQFVKLLFSFGAMLSAEIGEQSQQNGTLRALLKAYECVGGKFAKENDGISDFVIGAVIKSPIEQLNVDKIILEMNNRCHIQELTFLNALNIQMTPKDENERIENSKLYPFIDEAIRIDWNVLKEIIKQIDELSETIKSRQTNEDLKEFLEYVNKGIDVKLHMDKLDSDIQDYVKMDFGKYCKEIKGIDRKVDLNNMSATERKIYWQHGPYLRLTKSVHSLKGMNNI
uniref:Secreted protein n=1 Tax=Globodera pallida TaxID=36090 RepID=A0A183CHK6_GLOPA